MDDNTPFEKLPRSWQRKIRSLRAECGESRVTLRETREDLAEARMYIAQLESDAEDLRRGIDPRSGGPLVMVR